MAKMSTEYYADYIKKTTFDPESHSTRSKLEEHHEKDENGKVIEHPIEEAATDVKKKPASKTPKVEVEPTEVPEENLDEKGKGLWANIHAKRARGEKPNPPGHPDRPSAADLKRSQNEELRGDQHKLDHNKDYKIDKDDMKMVRKKGATKDHPMAEKKSLASLRNTSILDGKDRLKKMAKPSKPAIKPLTTTYQAEATFKVNVEGLPTMYIDGAGAGEIKSSLRKQLKDPKTITSIEKISPSEKKKELRAKVAEEEQVDEISSELAGRAHSSARKQVDYKKTTPTTAKKSDQGTKALAYHQRKAVNPSHTGTSFKGSPGGTDVAAAYKSSSEPARKTSGKYIDKLKKQGIDVSEEDRVDEISNRAKGAYVRVAARDAAIQSSKGTSAIYNNDSKDSKRQDIRNADRKRDNRIKGIDRATKGMKNEDTESVDELNRDTLGSYISKASDASKHKGMPTKKVDNRYAGVAKASKKIDKMEEDYSDQKAHLKKVGKGGQVSYTNSGKKMSGEYGGLKNKGGRSYAMVHHKTHSAMVPLPQINHKESVNTNEGIMDAISKVKSTASSIGKSISSNYKKDRNIAAPGKGRNILKGE
jgi:hypothetical protein